METDGWSLSDTEAFARYGDALVPRRREQIATVNDLLSDLPAGPVLDLCCGVGLLSEEYLSRNPQGRVLLVDGSAEMLGLAQQRLERFGGRHDVLRADIADPSWRVPSSCAGVMTSLAVHHLDGPGKKALYRDLYLMLLPGGVFAMADLVEPAGPSARLIAADAWEHAVAQTSATRFGGDEALRAFRDFGWNYYRLPGPDDFDMPSSVADNLMWLSQAGFSDVDLVWLYAGHAVFTARRAE